MLVGTYLQHARNDADGVARLIFSATAAHSERFPAACLPIRKYRGVVTLAAKGLGGVTLTGKNVKQYNDGATKQVVPWKHPSTSPTTQSSNMEDWPASSPYTLSYVNALSFPSNIVFPPGN